MTQNEEKEVIRTIRELRAALLGSLDGGQEGALHRLERLHDDFYHPENPQESIHIRIKTLESTENRRGGFIAAIAFVCGIAGTGMTLLVEWLTSRK